jgi:type II secretory pathway pseudopilin PulG
MEDTPDNQRHWRLWQLALAGIAIAIVSILLLLAGYVALGFDKPDGDHRQGRAQADLGQLVTALNVYFLENERTYPASLEPLRPAYNGRLPQDPYTKADYTYIRTMEGFELRCLGRDGAPGGTGPDKDIVFNEEGERRGQ